MAPFSSDEMKCCDEIEVSEMPIPLRKTHPSATKRLAKDWSLYLTHESAARRPSALKAAFKHLTIPGIISLGGGLPLPAYFPIHEVTVKVPRVGRWTEEETATHGSTISIVKYPKTNPRVGGLVNGVNGNRVNGVVEELDEIQVDALTIAEAAEVPTVGLSTTLQYGLGTGEPNLVAFLKHHTKMVHKPPYEDWSTTLTCGNTYSFYMCLRMLVERGDYILMEDYTYSSAISTCGPMGIKIVGVEMDEEGMTPEGLDYTMRTWDIRSRGARKPRVIYLVPYAPPPSTHCDVYLTVGVELDKILQAHPCPSSATKKSIESAKNTISSSSKMNPTTSSKWIHTPAHPHMSQISPLRTS
jgi:aromatic amino acid aminotransferase I / 2-aminoadipate transaminase